MLSSSFMEFFLRDLDINSKYLPKSIRHRFRRLSGVPSCVKEKEIEVSAEKQNCVQ